MNKDEQKALKVGDQVEIKDLSDVRVYDVLSVEKPDSIYATDEYVIRNKVSKRAFVVRDEDILKYDLHVPFYVVGAKYRWKGNQYSGEPVYAVDTIRKNEKGGRYALVKAQYPGRPDEWTVHSEYDFAEVEEIKS